MKIRKSTTDQSRKKPAENYVKYYDTNSPNRNDNPLGRFETNHCFGNSQKKKRKMPLLHIRGLGLRSEKKESPDKNKPKGSVPSKSAF